MIKINLLSLSKQTPLTLPIQSKHLNIVQVSRVLRLIEGKVNLYLCHDHNITIVIPFDKRIATDSSLNYSFPVHFQDGRFGFKVG